MQDKPHQEDQDRQADAYRSTANPRTREEEGVVQDGSQPQNGSGFKGQAPRPAQDSDWYGVRRPDQPGDTQDRLAEAAARKPHTSRE